MTTELLPNSLIYSSSGGHKATSVSLRPAGYWEQVESLLFWGEKTGNFMSNSLIC